MFFLHSYYIWMVRTLCKTGNTVLTLHCIDFEPGYGVTACHLLLLPLCVAEKNINHACWMSSCDKKDLSHQNKAQSRGKEICLPEQFSLQNHWVHCGLSYTKETVDVDLSERACVTGWRKADIKWWMRALAGIIYHRINANNIIDLYVWHCMN